MSYPKIYSQVHRYGDAVAVHIGPGETTYLTPSAWRKIALAGNEIARSIEREKFVDSSGLTFSQESEDGRNEYEFADMRPSTKS